MCIRDSVYKLIKLVSNSQFTKNKTTIGFVGAPWTLLVYIINKKSPKLSLNENFFEDKFLIDKVLKILDKFLKIHIKNQIENGAQIIQIFDSWAGLLKEKDLPHYIYDPTLSLVNYTKSLNVPVICFPKGIRNYKDFCEIIKPDAICIDYEVHPVKINKEIIRDKDYILNQKLFIKETHQKDLYIVIYVGKKKYGIVELIT